MKLNFDLNNVEMVEFGIGQEDGTNEAFIMVPIDIGVQNALRDMIEVTLMAMKDTDTPSKYESSEKYGPSEYVYLKLDDECSRRVRQLYEAVDLPISSTLLNDPSEIISYFARLTDKKGQRLIALNRATQFKGVLKRRLVRIFTDSLKLVEEKIFTLDKDFDILADDVNIHILHPTSFEFIARIQDEILNAVPQIVASLKKDIPYVDFGEIEEYAKSHTRIARYLASIRAQKETRNIDKQALKKVCKSTGVEVNVDKGILVVNADHLMGFLEVLDRRRYKIELIKGVPERFRAPSRKKIVS